MSLRKNERCPILNSFFCCRWKELWRQREVASPVRDGINQNLCLSLLARHSGSYFSRNPRTPSRFDFG
jgi:hypothetical protein